MPDETFKVADTNDASLENFFSRPLKIAQLGWAVGQPISYRVNPWQSYFENPRISNRIANYNLLRCKLKVRIMVNGNGFMYGRALAAYRPLWTYDDLLEDTLITPDDFTEASQRPHVFLDPTNSQGGTLTLPFVYYKNALSIPKGDWFEMGELTLRALQTLKHANGANEAISISIFVWAEDVQLSIPTAVDPLGLSPQGGEMSAKDEYGTGPVSRPAGIIAKIAGKLTSVPYIGMYARATEVAAKAVGHVAVMFGYSRPIVVEDIKPYKPTVLGNIANTNVPDTCQKLTLDVKQETTIDPRVMGLADTDELVISSIAQRPSYLTQFGWPVAAPAEQLLWNTEVSPMIWSTASDGGLAFPACAFASLPFGRWRGSMKYRFQIVASSFHKGRLKIVYDPARGGDNEYLTNYTYIIDLAKERDFTVDIGWGNDRSMLKTRDPGVAVPPYSTAPMTTNSYRFANGVLSVFVVNDLTVPNSTVDNDISINVFVSAGEDIEFFEPSSERLENFSYYGNPPLEAQGGELSENVPDSDLTKKEDEPIKMEESHDMAPGLSCSDNTGMVYYGDPIISFRQCLKRYNFHSVYAPTSSFNQLLKLSLSDFPQYRGYAPLAVTPTDTPGVNYNYDRMTLVNYLTPAYACRRGGLRWKYHRTGYASGSSDLMAVSRKPANLTGIAEQAIGISTLSAQSAGVRERQFTRSFPSLWDGGTLTATDRNPVIEAELPWYSPNRFAPARFTKVEAGDKDLFTFHELNTLWNPKGAESPMILRYVATAEDFNLAFFVGCPRIYRVSVLSDPPAL